MSSDAVKSLVATDRVVDVVLSSQQPKNLFSIPGCNKRVFFSSKHPYLLWVHPTS